MLTEILVFAIFLGVAYLPEALHDKHRKLKRAHPRIVAHAAVLLSIFSHSAVVEAVKGYVVHLVVYSGYIIHH